MKATDYLLAKKMLTVWSKNADNPCTWQVRSADHYKRFTLCRTAGEQAAPSFREDAVAECDWGDRQANLAATEFLWRRLTGLSSNALRGIWDQDGRGDAEPPRSVTVTGLPEAVQRFRWPVDESSQK